MQTRTSWQIQRAVVAALVLRELKDRFGRHRLGIVMVLLEPVLHLAVIIVMFGYLRGRADVFVDFPVFLLVGLQPFLLFKNIALGTMQGFKAEKGLLVYKQIKPMDLYIARITVQVTISLFVYLTILLILGWLDFSVVPVNPLKVIILLSIVVPFGLGLGLVLNVIGTALPESKLIIRICFMPLYFISGVLHPLYIVPSEIASWLLWNPLLRIVELSRESFFSNYPMPYTIGLSYVVFVTLLFLLIGLRAYRVRPQKSVRA